MFGSKLGKVEHAIEKRKEGELVKLIGEKEKDVRLAAIAGLGKVGMDDGFNAMVPMLHDSDPDIRIAVANALGEMGNGHARAFISNELSGEKDENVRHAFSAALSKIHDY